MEQVQDQQQEQDYTVSVIPLFGVKDRAASTIFRTACCFFIIFFPVLVGLFGGGYLIYRYGQNNKKEQVQDEGNNITEKKELVTQWSEYQHSKYKELLFRYPEEATLNMVDPYVPVCDQQGCYKLTMTFKEMQMEVTGHLAQDKPSSAVEFSYNVVCGNQYEGIGRFVQSSQNGIEVIKYFYFVRGGQHNSYYLEEKAEVNFRIPKNVIDDYFPVADTIACSFRDMEVNKTPQYGRAYFRPSDNSIISVDISGKELNIFNVDDKKGQDIYNFVWNKNFSHMVIVTSKGSSEYNLYLYKVGTGIISIVTEQEQSSLDGVVTWIDEESFVYHNSSGYFRYNINAQKRLSLTKQGYETLVTKVEE